MKGVYYPLCRAGVPPEHQLRGDAIGPRGPCRPTARELVFRRNTNFPARALIGPLRRPIQLHPVALTFKLAQPAYSIEARRSHI